MEIRDFFRTVITAEKGYFCLAAGGNGSGWQEEWYTWPDDLERIVARAEQLRSHSNAYFSSYLFKERSSLKEHVLPTRTIQADLDEADAAALPIVPTVLVQTSPGRHQAFWVVSEPTLDLEAHEVLSRKLTYAIPLCDRSGWPLGRKVRIPDTLNYKYLEGPREVTIVGSSLQTYNSTVFELLPDVPRVAAEIFESGFLDAEVKLPTGPNELLIHYRDKIGKAYAEYNTRQKDRSAALWSLMCALFRAGAKREEVLWISKHSANNKFAELKHNADRELAKDVLRAEQVVRSATLDPRALIRQARRATGPASERRGVVLDIVMSSMRDQGDFANTYGGSVFYIRRDSGRPIAITRRSDYFEMLLDLQYGLNAVEVDSHYVSLGIYAYSNSLPQSGKMAALSYYDPVHKFLLVHTGRKEVLQVNADGVRKVIDGAYGIVFPWDNSIEPFAPNLDISPSFDWADFLFSHTIPGTDALANIVSTSRDESLALLKVWTMFLLFRDLSGARPILATLGQPGSGKTTLFKKLYILLYGRHRAVATVTTPDDFDHGVANDPFYAIDNVDTWERWLPDRLAQSAGVTDIRKRKLYTDGDVITLRRQALVGISAHNPKFGREDVADRMLIFTFTRLEKFIAEQEIVATVQARRNDIWGAIIRDVQRILAEPMPGSEEAPQFRIEDFAKIGLWIARALGCEKEFRVGLERVKTGQRSFTLEEESLLTTALRRYTEKEGAGDWKTLGQLWGKLELLSDDVSSFIKTYKNSVALGKKLWSMQDALKTEFDIEWRNEPSKSMKLWRICKK